MLSRLSSIINHFGTFIVICSHLNRSSVSGFRPALRVFLVDSIKNLGSIFNAFDISNGGAHHCLIGCTIDNRLFDCPAAIGCVNRPLVTLFDHLCFTISNHLHRAIDARYKISCIKCFHDCSPVKNNNLYCQAVVIIYTQDKYRFP